MINKQNYTNIITTVSNIVTLDYQQEVGCQFIIDQATFDDVMAAKNWPLVGHIKDGYGNMQWLKIFQRQKHKSKRFMCAIRSSDQGCLLGLMAGRVSANDADGNKVSIDYIERSANAPELKGHAIAIAVKFAYVLADLLGSDYVKVNNPASKLIDTYQLQMPESHYVNFRKASYLIAPVNLPLTA
ncbi:hypothetical protein C9J19_20255 [Photobacterium phosphoreum]|uniref:hypothetical protein n=1 Tax=Photobacterium phosphoreum TaxID=659 RepID=UPI000D158C39|nr:hypothetical protein [Photobacterium phosphoreum]PSW24297.1 hypothetical protein C9J19_20255 [Photobacterium phosphoreum]